LSISFPKPVEAGKEYTGDIIAIGKSGDGITRIRGYVIFVKYTKAEDKNIKIKIDSVGNRFATAHVITGSSDVDSQ
jgi:predicted RNA-binding protein with TRAM domain